MRTMGELFSGHGWQVVLEPATLPDGRRKNVARVARADSVHILAFPQSETILMLREYRPYYGAYIWMLPSGHADKEDDVAVAAQRELREETGFRARELQYWCTTHHSEGLISANHLFLARELEPSSLPQDADELIEVHTLPLEEALARVLASPRVHTASAYGLLRYLRERPHA